MWTRRFPRKRDASTARRLLRSGAAFRRVQIATSRRRLRLAVSRFPSTRSHSAPRALISCMPSLRLSIPIIFFSATALLAIALPTHLGAGVRDAGEDVQQPSGAAEATGPGYPTWVCQGCWIRRKWLSESHLHGFARGIWRRHGAR